MITQEDELAWKHDLNEVNHHVDGIVNKLIEANGHPAAYMAIHMYYRPYLQWLHSAHGHRINPELVRNITIKLLSLMTGEIAMRLSGIDEDGVKIPVTDWAAEFIEDLTEEINSDLGRVEIKSN